MPIRVVPRETPQKANRYKGKRPTRTTRDSVIGIYVAPDGRFVAVVIAGGRLAHGHYYNGFVSGKHSVRVPSVGLSCRAIMPQNLFEYVSNVPFCKETAIRLAPTEKATGKPLPVAFVVLYADEDDLRNEVAKKLQAVVRGFLARRAYARERAAKTLQAVVRGFLARRAYARQRAAAKAEAEAAAAAAWQCFMHSLAQQYTRDFHELNDRYFRGVFGPVGSLLADAQYRAALLALQYQAEQNGLTPI